MSSSRHDAQGAASADKSPRALRYQVVYDLVLSLIEDQHLREGDRLPSSTELAALAEVSIISVRRALEELTQAGKIVRRQGIGTFVAPKRIISEPSHPGALLETLGGANAHVTLETSLLSIVVGLPSATHQEALGLEPGEPVWEICRLRSLSGVPKILEKAVLPLSRVPAVDEGYLDDGGSLYTFLRDRYDLADYYEEQALEVDRPNSWEREQLTLAVQDTIVRIRGVSFSLDGIAFDSYQQTYLAKEFVFYTSGSGSPQLLQPATNRSWSITPLGMRTAP